MDKARREAIKQEVIQLSAQGFTIREIETKTGHSRSKVGRILAEEKGGKVKQGLKSSVLVPVKKKPLEEEQQEFEEISKEIEVIPLSRYEYQATVLSVQQVFIDKAMRNMGLSDRLEALAMKLVDKAEAVLDLPIETIEDELKVVLNANRITNMIRPVAAAQADTARLALSLIEVGLQTGEISKYLESQEE